MNHISFSNLIHTTSSTQLILYRINLQKVDELKNQNRLSGYKPIQMKDLNQFPIDEYLLGMLSEEEVRNFDNQVQTNESLALEITQRRAIIEHLEVLEDRRMMEQIAQVHAQQKKSSAKVVPMRSRFRVFAVAAVVALLLTAGWWLMNNTTGSQDLYAQYYSSYTLRFGDRSSNEDLINIAGGHYIDKNYEAAGPIFEQILAEDPSQSKARFALGISRMECKKWKEAQAPFQQLIDQNDPLYGDAAAWYLALTYYKLDKTMQAKALLEDIVAKNGEYKTKAKDFLEKF